MKVSKSTEGHLPTLRLEEPGNRKTIGVGDGDLAMCHVATCHVAAVHNVLCVQFGTEAIEISTLVVVRLLQSQRSLGGEAQN